MTTSTWLPLGTNPELMTKFLHNLGLPKNWKIKRLKDADIELSFNDKIVPNPILAVMLLSPANVEIKKNEDRSQDLSNIIYHVKESNPSTSGSIALLHSIANNLDSIDLQDGSFLKKFVNTTSGISHRERGNLLNNAQEAIDIHRMILAEVEAEARGRVSGVDESQHYSSFIHKDGALYELDSRKSMPIIHGSTTQKTFLKDAIRICQQYMEKNSEDKKKFKIFALTSI